MKNDNFIHWYPGHIAKAEKQLKEKLTLCDVAIEVLDARIPFSSMYRDIDKLLNDKPRLVLLNKSDLVDKDELSVFIKSIRDIENYPVISMSAKSSSNISFIVKKVLELSEPRIQTQMAKGLLRRPSRVIVVGMPNVGKSSVINKLTNTSKTKTGAKAGVTRQQQWVRINKNIDLLDTPGIIPMKQDNQEVAAKLATVNSVSENAYDNEPVAEYLLEILAEKYPEKMKEIYPNCNLTLEGIANIKNWLISGSSPDLQRAAALILRDFRSGKMGKFILDKIEQ